MKPRAAPLDTGALTLHLALMTLAPIYMPSNCHNISLGRSG